MLVLSRKKLESIHIGEDIEVVVLEVAKNRVRLGFRCPSHISITRSEIQSKFGEISIELPVEDAAEHELVLA